MERQFRKNRYTAENTKMKAKPLQRERIKLETHRGMLELKE